MDKNQIAETVTKSALNLIPGVGGAIASILGDYLSVRKEARLNEFISNYFDEINQKQDCIVREYVCSDDFLDIFENILADVMQSRTELKRNMLNNLLVNSCTIPHTTYERTEEFQHLIDVLSPLSLLILSVFYRLRAIHMDGQKDGIEKYWTDIRDTTNIDDDTILLDYIGELEARSLIESFRNNTYSADSGVPVVANRPYITEKGIAFYTYITSQQAVESVVFPANEIIPHTPKAQIRTEYLEEFLREHTATEEDIQAIIDNQIKVVPQVTYGTEPPKDLKNGDHASQ